MPPPWSPKALSLLLNAQHRSLPPWHPKEREALFAADAAKAVDDAHNRVRAAADT